MTRKGTRNGKVLGLLLFLLVLPLFLPINYLSAQARKPETPAKPVIPSRDGNNFAISTDIFTIRFTGKQGQVPKFQFWYNTTDEKRTVYQVFFHQLFEFNDTDGDGAYNATRDKIEQMFALPSANLSLVGPENIINDEDVIGVRFNFTITGRKGGGLPEANITLQCSLYNEPQTISVAGENKYNVTGSAELKIDVIIESWPWKDGDNLLCLWWSINQQDMTLEPSITDTSVTFGRGYLSWISEATVYNETWSMPVPVIGTFNMTGKTVNVYLSYPNFQNKSLIHDPSLGVKPVPVPEKVPHLDEVHDYSDRVPKNFVMGILANRSTALLFQNFVLVAKSTRSLELSLTLGSEVAMHYFLLSLDPGKALNLVINVAVSPPSGVAVLDCDIDFYLSVEPNATVTLSATLGLHIDKTSLEAALGRDINVLRLTWAYWNGSNWVPVTSQIDANGYLIAQTTHFSTWTIVEIVPLQVAAQLSATTVTQGDTVTISAAVKDDAENPITGATVKATIGDRTISLSDQGNGNYQGTIDASGLKEGTYNVVVMAQKDGYVSIQTTRTLTVKAAIPWMLYSSIVAVVVIAATVATLAYRRKK